jgi:hypothetical protein
MARAPLFTVTNAGKAPRLAAFARRSVPIDIGRSKALPLTEDEAKALAADGFKVSGPDGKAITANREASKAKD